MTNLTEQTKVEMTKMGWNNGVSNINLTQSGKDYAFFSCTKYGKETSFSVSVSPSGKVRKGSIRFN